MSNYTYSKLSKFPNGVNLYQLQQQIRQSNIVCTCVGINTRGDVLSIDFNSALSAGELTTLNTIIDTFTPRADVMLSGVTVDTITFSNSPYTIGHNSVTCDTSGGNIIINLRKANRSHNGVFAIEKATSDANTVTIIPNGSDLINGSSSAIISTYRGYLIIQSDGTNWISTPSITSIIQTDNESALDITTTKGDILVDDGTRQQALNVGTNNQALIADSTTSLGVKWASIDHTTLSNIGTNTHAQIDSHISGTAVHGATGAVVGTTNVQTMLNKTMTDNTNNIIARSLWAGSGASSVSVYAATAPTTGQVLTATSSSTATWQTPSTSSSSAAGSKDQIQYRGNTAGSFAADSKFRWDTNTSTFFVSPTTPSNLTGLSVYVSDTKNNYMQSVVQNFSNNTQASSDMVCENDLGTDTTYFIDMGINSSGYSDPAFPLSVANDSYLYCASGKLTVGTYTSNDIVMHTGGFDTLDERLRIVDAASAKDAIIKCSSNLMLFNDSTANRPTVPQTGMLRYNTTSKKGEIYEDTAWKSLSTYADADSYLLIGEKSGSAPSAPSAGAKLYSTVRSGRRIGQIDTSSQFYEFQPGLYNRDIMYWNAQGNGTTVSTIGFGNTATGTATTRNVASTNLFTTMRRIGYVSAATAGSSAGTRHALQQFWRGNASGLGGFLYVARFGMSSSSAVATQRSFVGLIASTAVLGNADPSSNTAIPLLGFGVDSADSTWTFMHGNGTSITKDTLTGTFPARDLSVSMFEARIYCLPNSSTISYSLEVLGGGSIYEGSTSTVLPSTTTFLSPQIWTNNGTTALACGIDVVLQYVETF